VALGWMLWGWAVDAEEDALVKLQYGFILVALSYPVIFAIDRTNPELLLFVFVAGFFYFLYKRESPWLAALMLAMAIAFKLYPATLLLLLLAERRFAVLVRTVMLALGLTVLGAVLLAVLGHRSLLELWQMSSNEKAIYQQVMVIEGNGIQHGHSLWGLLRLPGFLSDTTVLGWQTTLYSVVVVMIFVLLAVQVVFREKERWKRVLLCVAPALLLPFVSADYTLIWMYFPLVFFVNAPRVSRWDVLYIVLFGVLLVPVDYYYLSTDNYGVSISVVVYPLALLALIAMAVFDRRPSMVASGETALSPEHRP